MHDVQSPADISEAVAAFAVGGHTGSAFEAALTCARQLLGAASTARDDAADAAVAPLGAKLREAFARGTALARDDGTGDAAPVLAVALAIGANSSVAAEAVAVGCEVAARVQRGAASAPDFAAHWNARAVAGRFGAAMCAARLLGLDSLQARHALGLAATQAAGLRADGGAALCGKAALDALEGAALAKAGFTSAAASIEGRRGFAAVMAPGFELSALVADLGEVWISADAARG